MPAVVGARFGHYELLSRIGEGGMGVVYRARDLDLQRAVAIKFLSEQYAADADRLVRFSQEARAASALARQWGVPMLLRPVAVAPRRVAAR